MKKTLNKTLNKSLILCLLVPLLAGWMLPATAGPLDHIELDADQVQKVMRGSTVQAEADCLILVATSIHYINRTTSDTYAYGKLDGEGKCQPAPIFGNVAVNVERQADVDQNGVATIKVIVRSPFLDTPLELNTAKGDAVTALMMTHRQRRQEGALAAGAILGAYVPDPQ